MKRNWDRANGINDTLSERMKKKAVLDYYSERCRERHMRHVENQMKFEAGKHGFYLETFMMNMEETEALMQKTENVEGSELESTDDLGSGGGGGMSENEVIESYEWNDDETEEKHQARLNIGIQRFNEGFCGQQESEESETPTSDSETTTDESESEGEYEPILTRKENISTTPFYKNKQEPLD